jgi:hypothetical protein
VVGAQTLIIGPFEGAPWEESCPRQFSVIPKFDDSAYSHVGGRIALDETMRKFFFERDIPEVGSFEREQLRGAAQKFNEVLAELGPDIQWKESFVAADKTFCVYYAANEELIYRYVELSRFPATKVTEVRKMIDPTTAE